MNRARAREMDAEREEDITKQTLLSVQNKRSEQMLRGGSEYDEHAKIIVNDAVIVANI